MDKNKEQLNKSDFTGIGIGTMEDVEAINKALQPGYGLSPAEQTGGGALRVESLENTLKVVTFETKHFTTWREMPKIDAFSTVEEYARLEGYGGLPGTSFVPGGELPPEGDSNYTRQYALVKFLGDTRKITHPMTLVRNIVGDKAALIARENLNATNKILRDLEYGLFWGYSKGKDNSEWFQWDSISRQVASDVKVDAAGSVISESLINDTAQLVLDNYGVPSLVIMHYQMLNTLVKQFHDRQRILLPSGTDGYRIGANVTEFVTQAGILRIIGDLFCEKTPKPVDAFIGNYTLDVSGVNTNAVEDNTISITPSSYLYNKSGTTFSFEVGLVTKYGEKVVSVPDVTLTGNNGIKVSGNGLPDDVAQVRLYIKEGADFFRVDTTYNNAGTFEFKYDGSTHPDTYTVYIIDNTPEVWAFKQLTPLIKMDLATIEPSYRWMVLLYGVPVVYAPRKIARIVNVKA